MRGPNGPGGEGLGGREYHPMMAEPEMTAASTFEDDQGRFSDEPEELDPTSRQSIEDRRVFLGRFLASIDLNGDPAVVLGRIAKARQTMHRWIANRRAITDKNPLP